MGHRRVKLLTLATILGGVLLVLSGCTPSDMQSLWTSYGNDTSYTDHWTGGDGAYSTELPDGRKVWAFSDVYLGPVNPDGTRPPNAPLIHNAVVVQSSDNNTLGPTLHQSYPSGAPAPFINTLGSDYYWVGANAVDNNKYVMTVFEINTSGQIVGIQLASWNLPDLTYAGGLPYAVPYTQGILWGNLAFLKTGGYYYIYGTKQQDPYHGSTYVARAPVGGLVGPWAYWTGTTWSSNEADARPLVDTSGAVVPINASVVAANGHFDLVGKPNVFWSDIESYRSSSPVGPFSQQTNLYTMPESGVACGSGGFEVTYGEHAHPEFPQSDGSTLFDYSVNCYGSPDNHVSIYRPRYVGLSLP